MINMGAEPYLGQQSGGDVLVKPPVSFVYVDYSGTPFPDEWVAPGLDEYNRLLHGRDDSFWKNEISKYGLDFVTSAGFVGLRTLRKRGIEVPSPLVQLQGDQRVTDEDLKRLLGDPRRLLLATRAYLGEAVMGSLAECMAYAMPIIDGQGIDEVTVELHADVNYDQEDIRATASWHGCSEDALVYRVHPVNLDKGVVRRETRFIEEKDKSTLLRVIQGFFGC